MDTNAQQTPTSPQHGKRVLFTEPDGSTLLEPHPEVKTHQTGGAIRHKNRNRKAKHSTDVTAFLREHDARQQCLSTHQSILDMGIITGEEALERNQANAHEMLERYRLYCYFLDEAEQHVGEKGMQDLLTSTRHQRDVAKAMASLLMDRGEGANDLSGSNSVHLGYDAGSASVEGSKSASVKAYNELAPDTPENRGSRPSSGVQLPPPSSPSSHGRLENLLSARPLAPTDEDIGELKVMPASTQVTGRTGAPTAPGAITGVPGEAAPARRHTRAPAFFGPNRQQFVTKSILYMLIFLIVLCASRRMRHWNFLKWKR